MLCKQDRYVEMLFRSLPYMAYMWSGFYVIYEAVKGASTFGLCLSHDAVVVFHFLYKVIFKKYLERWRKQIGWEHSRVYFEKKKMLSKTIFSRKTFPKQTLSFHFELFLPSIYFFLFETLRSHRITTQSSNFLGKAMFEVQLIRLELSCKWGPSIRCVYW